jgi:hypothetical protein
MEEQSDDDVLCQKINVRRSLSEWNCGGGGEWLLSFSVNVFFYLITTIARSSSTCDDHDIMD